MWNNRVLEMQISVSHSLHQHPTRGPTNEIEDKCPDSDREALRETAMKANERGIIIKYIVSDAVFIVVLPNRLSVQSISAAREATIKSTRVCYRRALVKM